MEIPTCGKTVLYCNMNRVQSIRCPMEWVFLSGWIMDDLSLMYVCDLCMWVCEGRDLFHWSTGNDRCQTKLMVFRILAVIDWLIGWLIDWLIDCLLGLMSFSTQKGNIWCPSPPWRSNIIGEKQLWISFNRRNTISPLTHQNLIDQNRRAIQNG